MTSPNNDSAKFNLWIAGVVGLLFTLFYLLGVLTGMGWRCPV
jgi:hypothetical protein